LNFDKDYVRLNEFPEWYTVDENTLYRLRQANSKEEARVLSGAELIAGVVLRPGEWTLEALGKAPYAGPHRAARTAKIGTRSEPLDSAHARCYGGVLDRHGARDE
jgi:hypothetical protein